MFVQEGGGDLGELSKLQHLSGLEVLQPLVGARFLNGVANRQFAP